MKKPTKPKGRGGARPGAGRPAGPPELVRRNRIVVLLADAELDRLERIAGERPLGTVAYELLSAAIKRRRVV